MKIITYFFSFLVISSCTSYTKYENFKERKDSTKIVFQDNAEECQKFGHLQSSRAEGSKRAGEIMINKKRYFISCMNRKGWISQVSN